MLAVLGFIATIAVAVSFIYSSVTDRMLAMQWANVVCSVVLFPINLIYAPWNSLLNVVFCFGGLVWLVKYYTRPPLTNTCVCCRVLA